MIPNLLGAVDTNITNLITDATSTWDTVRPFGITLLLFFTGVILFLKLRRKS